MNQATVTYEALRKVFARPAYTIIGLSGSTVVFLIANIFPNRALVRYVLTAHTPFTDKLRILSGLLQFFRYNENIYAQILFLIVVVSAGMNIALLVYYIRNKVHTDKSAGVGILGIVAGLIGLGCGACGSVILSSILGLTLSAQITTYLPLGGLEFSIAGLLLLSISSVYISHKIIYPPVCAIDK